MATRIDLPPLPLFDPLNDQSSLSQRWTQWLKRFETYIIATNIKDDKQKRAMLLYQAGQETKDIFETLEDTGDDYDTAKSKLTEYFSPKKNVDYEIFQFRQAAQIPGETVEQYTTRLRKLAANCEFTDIKTELKSAIIQNCLSKRLRRFALREDKLTLESLLAKARSLEASELQAMGMEEKMPQSVNRVHGKSGFRPRVSTTKSAKPNPCRKCGQQWPHEKGPCPAQGQTCRKCGKRNHYAKMCLTPDSNSSAVLKRPSSNLKQKSQIKQITKEHIHDDSSDTDDEYVYSIGKDKSRVPRVTVRINDVEVPLVVDTGAAVNIIDKPTYKSIIQTSPVELCYTTKRLFAYGSKQQLPSIGQFKCTIKFKHKEEENVLIHVLKGNHG